MVFKILKKILIISSNQHFINVFLINFIKNLSKNNKIYLVTNIDSDLKRIKNVEYFHIPVRRKISIFFDLISLIKIIKILFSINPSTLVTLTPKSIIFGTIIKFLKPQIKRIHIYTGITWTNFKNIKKFLFILLDKINIEFSNKIIFDSKEQIEFLEKNGIKSKKFNVIHHGSITGVDTNNFYKYDYETKKKLKSSYNIPLKAKVILYLGRMDIEKGILDLIKSFDYLEKKNELILLLVGKDEMNIQKYISQYKKRVIYLPHTENVQRIYNIADIFCLPSKREGFGNVLIESSACEVPIVGSNIFGLKSSLIHNFNGLTFKVGNISDLCDKLQNLINDKKLCNKLGKNGRDFVKKKFKPACVNESLKNLILE